MRHLHVLRPAAVCCCLLQRTLMLKVLRISSGVLPATEQQQQRQQQQSNQGTNHKRPFVENDNDTELKAKQGSQQRVHCTAGMAPS
jgi:hemolysin activation/secretion protein